LHPSFTKKLEKVPNIGNYNGHIANTVDNPLAKPYPWWLELYQRLKLFPWRG
jgi:hypothetical protein